MSERIAIVAALEAEVAPLVARWRRATWNIAGVPRPVFEGEGTTLVCGGIGPRAATAATRVIVDRVCPHVLLSVGVAGALQPDIRVGSIVRPAEVVNADLEKSFVLPGGRGLMLTYGVIAGAADKAALVQKFPHALAVDMEGAAVAEVAAGERLPCVLVKAISDELNFAMPPLGQFVDSRGTLRIAGIVAHVLPRPWMWGTMWHLKANSALAARYLAAAVNTLLADNDLKNLKLATESRVY